MSPTLQNRQHAVNAGSGRTPAGEAFNELLTQVLGLTRRFTAAGEALAKPAGQTLARWVVLAECKDSPMTVSDIARRIGLARQSVQRLADVLVSDRQCAYLDNPHHQRAKLLVPTEPGRAALAQIEAAQRQWADSLGERIGEAVLRQGCTALAAVRDALEDAGMP